MLLVELEPRQRLGGVFAAGDIGARAEAFAVAREHDRSHVRVFLRALKRRVYLTPHRARERVSLFGAIERNDRDGIADFIQNEIGFSGHDSGSPNVVTESSD